MVILLPAGVIKVKMLHVDEIKDSDYCRIDYFQIPVSAFKLDSYVSGSTNQSFYNIKCRLKILNSRLYLIGLRLS